MREDDRNRDLAERIRELLHPGPLDWVLKLNKPKRRFHPGPHLHGLEERDPTRRPVET